MLFSLSLYRAQGQTNRFDDPDNESAIENISEKEPQMAESTGPPGDDDLPIDDYVPLLLITAVGLITYHSYRKRPSL
ncbi:MAG: hypothetical protein KJ689_07530 [Bacteroidetes bacterium]|nr:hypothetical protein [Bacteroidota bacterium]